MAGTRKWGSHESTKSVSRSKKGGRQDHNMNARIMISVSGKILCQYEHYKEFDQNGGCTSKRKQHTGLDWSGYIGSFYDALLRSRRKTFFGASSKIIYIRWVWMLGMDAF